MAGLLFLFVLLVVLIAIPVGIRSRIKTERGMLAEGRRIADQLQADSAHARATGLAAEVEAQRLIDQVVAPKFGGTGASLLRTPSIRQAVFETVLEGFALPGTIRATEDWVRDPAVPRRGDHSSTVIVARPVHNGLTYDLHSGGEAVYRRDGQAFTWRSEAGFQAWTEGATRRQ